MSQSDINASRLGTSRTASSQANVGTRPGTRDTPRNSSRLSAPLLRNRESVSGASVRGNQRARTRLESAHKRASGGEFKYLKHRAVSPATMRHYQVKDDLKLLTKKYGEDVEKEKAREARRQATEQGRADFFSDQKEESVSSIPRPAPSTQACHSIKHDVELQDNLRIMAELCDTMTSSFRSSLESVKLKREPLEQRLVNKQAVEAERSNILRALQALRGQRLRLKRRVEEEEQARLEAKSPPIPSFAVNTTLGEVFASDGVISKRGDDEMWQTESRAAKGRVLSEMSFFSSALIAHMPALADIVQQQQKLETERHSNAAQLEVIIRPKSF